MRRGLVMMLMVILLTLHPFTASGNDVQQSKLLKLTVTLWLFDNDTARLDLVGVLHKGAGPLCIEFPLLEWGRYYAMPSLKKIAVVYKRPQNLNTSIISNKLYAQSLLLCFLEDSGMEHFEVSLILDKRIYVAPEIKTAGRTKVILPFVLPNISMEKPDIKVRIALPKNSTISPAGSIKTNISILTDKQGNLIVEFSSPVLRWVAPSPFHEQYIYLLSYSHKTTSSSTTPNVTSPQSTGNESNNKTNQSSNSLIVVAGGAISLLALLLAVVLIRSREGRVKSTTAGRVVFPPIKDVNKVIQSLDEDELQLLKVLAEHPNTIKQKDLPSMTGFSKSKVSRILKKLSAMGIVVREGQKKTKIIWLNPVVREHLTEQG